MSKAISDLGKGKILTYQIDSYFQFIAGPVGVSDSVASTLTPSYSLKSERIDSDDTGLTLSSFIRQNTFFIQNPNLTSSQCAAVKALPIMLIYVNRQLHYTSNRVENRPFRLILNWTRKQTILCLQYWPLWINYRTRDLVKASG